MLVEFGEVTKLEFGAVWVKTIRRSTCGTCSAKNGCGQQLLNKFGAYDFDVRATIDRLRFHEGDIQVGDRVEIGIAEGAVVLGSLLVYGLPLLLMLLVISICGSAGMELSAAIMGMLSLAFGVVLVRWVLKRFFAQKFFEPTVLHRLVG